MNDLREVWPFSDVPLDDISIYDGAETFLSDYARAPIAHRTVFSAYWLQAEVLNGGLSQFFSNDTGVLAPEAVAACRAFSMPALAAAIERAMAWFGDPYPRDREPRLAALEALVEAQGGDADPFGEVDEVADLIYDENGGLHQAATRFVEAHGS